VCKYYEKDKKKKHKCSGVVETGILMTGLLSYLFLLRIKTKYKSRFIQRKKVGEISLYSLSRRNHFSRDHHFNRIVFVVHDLSQEFAGTELRTLF